MTAPVGHGQDVQIKIVEVLLEQCPIFPRYEAEVPVTGIPGSFAMAFKEQPKVRVI